MQAALQNVLPTKGKKNWTMDDVPWAQFNRNLVCPELLKIVKAAALVEYNAYDYATYLSNVFHDDEEFKAAIKVWAEEEVQHGAVLGRWAEMVDPSFNFQESFKRFVAGYRIPLDATESVRGSKAGELMARCIVETGTSSYYTALSESAKEPVLKVICDLIAGDELRHYKLFYTHMKRYLDKENLSSLQRLKIGIGRIAESEDDELAFAYYAANSLPASMMAANDNASVLYNRAQYTHAYVMRAFSCYRSAHISRMVSMVFKACGLNTQSWMARAVGSLAWLSMKARIARAKKAVAKKAA